MSGPKAALPPVTPLFAGNVPGIGFVGSHGLCLTTRPVLPVTLAAHPKPVLLKSVSPAPPVYLSASCCDRYGPRFATIPAKGAWAAAGGSAAYGAATEERVCASMPDVGAGGGGDVAGLAILAGGRIRILSSVW